MCRSSSATSSAANRSADWPLLAGAPDAKNPHESYLFYYAKNELQALTSGQWKLILPHTYPSAAGQAPPDGGKPMPYRQVRITEPELYDLSSDREERTNVAARNQDVVARLLTLAEKARAELGDSLTGRTGSQVREPGRLQVAAK
ncbi:MAG TPA: hypothetical protein VGO90_10080 [Chthoniobacteraceae bacterium]|jgi:arylsulfatase|nr:hypothetical protein [Chthoniobacteraceae bacterium]